MADPAPRIEVPLDRLIDLVDRSLAGIGVPAEDIETIREVLLYAELRGNNQGLVKIPARGVLPSKDAAPMETVRPVPCSALIRVNGNSGMVAAVNAASEAAEAVAVATTTTTSWTTRPRVGPRRVLAS